ncbi:MAG: DNA polymerase III, subunit gamma and tau [Candidatus Andersenbacteria bacterium CG10_big_fil_rev_8_21_14_0_10_54_11]|uniref:DNA polymerase III subunit gamma/tau n=1 Tax=Candidatus Andersenbacteria bacterium CG10_big_fil_rev_8_21_14_0_10_54_11 TaxID=1974485 RepID=A0A2M6WYJ0_9BACT|nr:MAG: DNA polymerase III, subunit gamma and tau [Candidatus Andersenbacteria bacterium CG10_big_fil_rev_8_21_14_0_10_54_11]
MATLYRQYRPASFADIFGQAGVTGTLTQAILKDKLTHAYLFYGPRGTGKTTTARVLAARLNCMQPREAEPCGICESCTAARAGSHLDIIEIDAASNRGIDDIRALRERLGSTPAMGTYKIYIVDEVHMLTHEAASALLKTLEEPVRHVIFILATTELHKVLPTILSRCQVYRFKRATREELLSRLQYVLAQEARDVPEDVLDFVISRSDGCYRDAESLLGQILTLHEETVDLSDVASSLGLPSPALVEKFVAGLAAGESAPSLAAADEAYAAGVDPEQLIREAIRRARDAALAGDDFSRWSRVVRALVQAMQDLMYVPQPLIAIHLAVLTVCTKRGRTSTLQTEGQKGAVSVRQKADPQPVDEPPGALAAVQQVKESGPVATAPSLENGDIGGSDLTPVEGVSVDAVKAVWDQLIDAMKAGNPVASTFLRSVEPIKTVGNVITIHTRYALHKSYFDNPRHKKLLEEHLFRLLNTKVTAVAILEQGSGVPPPLAEQRKQKEAAFAQMVEDVLGK